MRIRLRGKWYSDPLVDGVINRVWPCHIVAANSIVIKIRVVRSQVAKNGSCGVGAESFHIRNYSGVIVRPRRNSGPEPLMCRSQAPAQTGSKAFEQRFLTC